MSRNVVLTDTIAFAAKSNLFPGSVFAIGPEVMAKITDPVHYFNSIVKGFNVNTKIVHLISLVWPAVHLRF